MNEDNKSHIGWRNRDWFWLVGVLIAIMILMIADFYNSDRIELNFSIISSAVSIALALVAIFIALKQDSDNQRVNYKVDSKLELIANDLKNVDEKVNNVVTNIIANVAEETADTISSDTFIEKKDNYSKEEVEELLSNYNNQIKDTLYNVVKQNINNEQKSVFTKKMALQEVKTVGELLLVKFKEGEIFSRHHIWHTIRRLGIKTKPSVLLNRLIEYGYLNQEEDENFSMNSIDKFKL